MPSTFKCKPAIFQGLYPPSCSIFFLPSGAESWRTPPPPSSIQPSMARLMDLAMPWSLPFLNPPGKSSEDKILALWEAILPPAQPSQSSSSLNLSHCSTSEWKGILDSLHPFRLLVAKRPRPVVGPALGASAKQGHYWGWPPSPAPSPVCPLLSPSGGPRRSSASLRDVSWSGRVPARRRSMPSCGAAGSESPSSAAASRTYTPSCKPWPRRLPCTWTCWARGWPGAGAE